MFLKRGVEAPPPAKGSLVERAGAARRLKEFSPEVLTPSVSFADTSLGEGGITKDRPGGLFFTFPNRGRGTASAVDEANTASAKNRLSAASRR